jgi:hypothetical protein
VLDLERKGGVKMRVYRYLFSPVIDGLQCAGHAARYCTEKTHAIITEVETNNDPKSSGAHQTNDSSPGGGETAMRDEQMRHDQCVDVPFNALAGMKDQGARISDILSRLNV